MRTLTKIFLLFVPLLGMNAQIKTRQYLTDTKLAPRAHNVDFTKLSLVANFEPENGLIHGKVTEVFTPLQENIHSIVLDAIDMTITEVKLNGVLVQFEVTKENLTVFIANTLHWGEVDSLTITYSAAPKKGLYFVGWNDKTNTSRKQIWSQGQSLDNRCWIPMYDEMNDKLISDIQVSFDKEYKVISNGTLVKKKELGNGEILWHYKMTHPHAPYLIMLAIGKYDRLEEKSRSGVPLNLYYYPEWSNRAHPTYKYSKEMFDFFEKEIGVPYAWESYSQVPVQEFMFGAMENTTATIYGDFFEVDERAYLDKYYVGVNAHELAHQWFGDLVTARSDAHHWLQESFATYYNQLFEAVLNGPDQFAWARRLAQNQALEESAKNNYPVAHSEAGQVRHYPKGAFVLHMLKNIGGGREAYNKAIKAYLEKHKYANVDSHDLLVAFEETLGVSLDWFWEEWVYKGGEPHYKVNFEETADGNQFTVQQEGDLFNMPIQFSVFYTDGAEESKTITIEKPTEIVTLDSYAKKSIAYVLFDPNNEVLKSVSFNKPLAYLKTQALKAVSTLDRYDALVGLRENNLTDKRETLYAAYEKETFHATRNEIINQLLQDKQEKSKEIILKAINDKDVMVRKNVIAHLTQPDELQLEALEKQLPDSSYELTAQVLEKLCAAKPASAPKYLSLVETTDGAVGHNVLVKRLELSYNYLQDKAALAKLVTLATNAYEFRTRMFAMGALKRCDYFDEPFIDALLEGMTSGNSRLNTAAAETLAYFYVQTKNKNLINQHIEGLSDKPLKVKQIRELLKTTKTL